VNDTDSILCRKLAGQAQKRLNDAVEIHRRLLVENVPQTVTKEDMFDLVAAAGCGPPTSQCIAMFPALSNREPTMLHRSREHVENITRQATGHSVKYVVRS
jgi:hypothetical protein